MPQEPHPVSAPGLVDDGRCWNRVSSSFSIYKYQNQLYEQLEGTPMECPLSPIVANL